MTFNSRAEREAAPIFAAMPIPALPCDDFAEASLPKFYTDSSGVVLEGKPDFVARQRFTVTCIESKDGKLNHHLTQESSRAALQSEYEYYTQRVTLQPLSHSFLSGYFWSRKAGRVCIDHGWNHALFKVLALQAEHGWQRYLVVFKNNPSKADATRYLDAGLVFCTQKALPDLLRTIELAQHGIFLPFQHEAKRGGYAYTITADHTDHGKSEAAVAASDRAKFLAAAAEAAAAEAAFGQEPF